MYHQSQCQGRGKSPHIIVICLSALSRLVVIAVLLLSLPACSKKPVPKIYTVVVSVTRDSGLRIGTANFESDVVVSEGSMGGTRQHLMLGNASGVLVDVSGDLKKLDADNVKINLKIDCRLPVFLGIDDFSNVEMKVDGVPVYGGAQLAPGTHTVLIIGKPEPR